VLEAHGYVYKRYPERVDRTYRQPSTGEELKKDFKAVAKFEKKNLLMLIKIMEQNGVMATSH
jgi:hypothetical protein